MEIVAVHVSWLTTEQLLQKRAAEEVYRMCETCGNTRQRRGQEYCNCGGTFEDYVNMPESFWELAEEAS